MTLGGGMLGPHQLLAAEGVPHLLPLGQCVHRSVAFTLQLIAVMRGLPPALNWQHSQSPWWASLRV